MKKAEEQERHIAKRLYELDKQVYERTGSTLGKVFPAETSIAIKNIMESLHSNRKHFLKNEMTLISNMIGTIKKEEQTQDLTKEYNDLEKIILEYNPELILPHSIDSTSAKAAQRFNGDNKMIICISRQFGTGGHTIGFKLAQRLGIAYYDKEIINMACDHLGITVGNMEEYTEDSRGSFLTNLGKNFSTHSDLLFFSQSNLICDMAAKESSIFMGRCADMVLANRHIPRLSIFLSAPFKERVKYEMAMSGTDYRTASALVKKMDRSRRNYYQSYTGLHWGYSENYDLCINTFFYGEDETVNLIENMTDLAYFKLDKEH